MTPHPISSNGTLQERLCPLDSSECIKLAQSLINFLLYCRYLLQQNICLGGGGCISAPEKVTTPVFVICFNILCIFQEGCRVWKSLAARLYAKQS